MSWVQVLCRKGAGFEVLWRFPKPSPPARLLLPPGPAGLGMIRWDCSCCPQRDLHGVPRAKLCFSNQ